MSLSRIDLLRAQLQSQLQRRGTAPSPSATVAHTPAPRTVPLPQLRALKAHGTRDSRALSAALVQDLLLEALGADLCNDPEFQRAVHTIAQDMCEDPELLALCMQCADQA